MEPHPTPILVYGASAQVPSYQLPTPPRSLIEQNSAAALLQESPSDVLAWYASIRPLHFAQQREAGFAALDVADPSEPPVPDPLLSGLDFELASLDFDVASEP
jgi:hypothetical protein